MLSFKMPAFIKTKRLNLKKHFPELAPKMFEVVESDRERLEKFMPWPSRTQSQEDSLKYIIDSIEKWGKKEIFDFGVYDICTDQYLGNVGLHTINLDSAKAEIGYWLIKEAEGKGLMSEAVKELERICFELGFNRLEIRCSTKNKKSQALPKSLGYKLEGILRQNYKTPTGYEGTMVFAKINDDLKVKQSL